MHPQAEWRQKTGINQKTLARESGVDQGALSKIENGSYGSLGVDAAIKICIAMARLSAIVPPLRVTQYGSRQLALTYRNTMEAHHHGMAKGEAAGTTAEEKRGSDRFVNDYGRAEAREAVQAANKRARARRTGGRKRKAAKTAKARKG